MRVEFPGTPISPFHWVKGSIKVMLRCRSVWNNKQGPLPQSQQAARF